MPSSLAAPPRANGRARTAAAPTSEPNDAARTSGPVRSLPTGRAVVGALLVTVAAVGTFAALSASHAPPTHSYLVAAHPIAAGDRLTTADVRSLVVDLPEELARQAFVAPRDLEGAIALAPIDADALIAPAQVRRADDPTTVGARPTFSFAIDREKALDGRLQRGERVDLIATYGTGADAYTEVTLRDAEVIDAPSGNRSAVGSSGKITLILAVDTEADVLRGTHAAEIAKVTVVRSAHDPSGTDTTPERFQPDVPDERATNGSPSTTRAGAPR